VSRRHHQQDQQHQRGSSERRYNQTSRRNFPPEMGYDRSPLLASHQGSPIHAGSGNKYSTGPASAANNNLGNSGFSAASGVALPTSRSFHHRLGLGLRGLAGSRGRGSLRGREGAGGDRYALSAGGNKAESAYQDLDQLAADSDSMFITPSATSGDIAGGLTSRLSG
jgi:hypothetical protein